MPFLSRKTESFSAKDIKAVVANIKDIVNEKKWQYCIEDVYAGLYYDQTINFADSFMRATLFEYYLRAKNVSFHYCTEQEVYSILAYYTEDNFTGKEISDIVNDASEMAEIEDSAIIEKHLIVALYKLLMKKAKPYVISTTSRPEALPFQKKIEVANDIKQIIPVRNKRFQNEFTSYTITPLSDEEKFLESKYLDGNLYSKKLVDYRTKLQPNWGLRFMIIQYFLEDTPHDLSDNQINSLAKYTEGFSWYSISQIIKLAKDHAIGTCARKLQFSHLETAAYEFAIKLEEIKENKGCILS